MNASGNWSKFIGLALHAVVGGLMIFVGSVKVLGLFPADALEHIGLADQVRLIGAGELISGILLLHPRTSPLGILLTSSFWGGAICIHMAHAESYLLQATLLALSWIGSYLRNPATLDARSVPYSPARLHQEFEWVADEAESESESELVLS